MAIAQLIRHALIDLELRRSGWFKPGGGSLNFSVKGHNEADK